MMGQHWRRHSRGPNDGQVRFRAEITGAATDGKGVDQYTQHIRDFSRRDPNGAASHQPSGGV